MVGGLSVVGSSVMESQSGPCLCLNALSSSVKSGASPAIRPAPTSLELGTSFVDWRFCSKVIMNRTSCKKQHKNVRRLGIVNELGGQYEDTFGDVKTQLLNYFTYKAVRTVLNQLYEMNPPQYTWLYHFVSVNNPNDGKRFLRLLGKERQELAERVMITRLHLYGKWVKKCDHAQIYQEISEENLELMRERLMETVVWPSDDTNTEKIG